MSKPYTLDELLAIVVAREIHDYENVVLGVGVPMTAGALAKALFAPHATLMMESGIVDIRPLLSLNNIADAHSCRGFSYATDLFSTFTMTYRGFVDVCFLGVAQVDKYGNLNTTVIGDYEKPTMRLAGIRRRRRFYFLCQKNRPHHAGRHVCEQTGLSHLARLSGRRGQPG